MHAPMNISFQIRNLLLILLFCQQYTKCTNVIEYIFKLVLWQIDILDSLFSVTLGKNWDVLIQACEE